MGAYIDQISGDLNEKDMKETEVKTKNISKDDIQSVSDREGRWQCVLSINIHGNPRSDSCTSF